MRRMSEARKEREGYGCGSAASYTPYIMVGEFGSVGTTSNPIDWITGRTVHLFSQAEALTWYLLRWNDNVFDIREQYPLNLTVTKKLAAELGIRHPNNGNSTMTSDFLVDLSDGSQHVISVKTDKSQLKNTRTVEKLYLEKEYWRMKNIPFHMVFKDDLNQVYSENIRCAVAFYDKSYISDDISIIKHLIAHKIISPDMETAPLNYVQLLYTYRKEVLHWKTINQV